MQKEIENTFGQPITRAKDCELLAQEIERVTCRPISSATLRRLFGLLKSESKMSRYNQQTLKMYIEGKSGLEDQFNDWTSPDEETVSSIIDILFEKFENPGSELADYLLKLRIPSHVFFEVLRRLIVFSVEGSHHDFITKLYQTPHYILENPKIFRTLGVALINQGDYGLELLNQLAQSVVVRRQFFERFIDMGNFKIYHKWLEVFLKHEKIALAQYWAKSLLLYGKFLSQQSVDAREILEYIAAYVEDFKTMHPYTAARVLGIGLVLQDKSATDHIQHRFQSELNSLKINPQNPPLFSVMLLQYLLLSGHIVLGKQCYRNLSLYQSSRTSHIDYGIPFMRKIAGYFIGIDTNFTLDEVKHFNSGHTNEDVVVKYYASKYAVDSFGRIQDYQRGLIISSGFKRLMEIFR